jgi:hypothetical protein
VIASDDPAEQETSMCTRATLAVAAAALAFVAAPVQAQVGAGSIKGMLANASDAALDKLSKPGAFSADAAIRIALPGQAEKLGALMKLTDKAGLTNDLSGSLNRAAEQAAGQAKPIFRSAIDKATMSDAVSVARGGDTGATDYLKRTSGGEILAKLQPLVKAALDKSGVLKQTAQLSSFGLDAAKLTDYVTQKASDGIFTYVGREEARLRQDPIGSGKELLKGLKF